MRELFAPSDACVIHPRLSAHPLIERQRRAEDGDLPSQLTLTNCYHGGDGSSVHFQ